MQGLFLMVVVHGISKQVVAEEPETKEETSEGAKKIKPGDYKLEEVLNNPSFIRQPFCYVVMVGPVKNMWTTIYFRECFLLVL